MKNIKDTFSTIAGILQLIAVGVLQAIQTSDGAKINWTLVILSISVAVFGFLQGKNADVSRKTVYQIKKQKETIPEATPDYTPTPEQKAAMGVEKKD